MSITFFVFEKILCFLGLAESFCQAFGEKMIKIRSGDLKMKYISKYMIYIHLKEIKKQFR